MNKTEMAHHIEIASGVRGGKPRLRGTRITVDDIVVMHLKLGLSLPEIAGKYDLSPAAVHAAMTYFYDHRGDIERAIAEDRAYAEAFQRNNASLLREKLRSLRLAA
jgi:uncharacterized protein (DUF433 family)